MDNRDSEIEKALEHLLALVNDKQNPNINKLWLIAKDIEAIKLNIKFFGYELAQRLRDALPKNDNPPHPGHVGLKSKPSTQSDIETNWVAYWAKKLAMGVVYHRKVWELCYVMQALSEQGVLREGMRGLGFGCGQEPIPSLLASMGINITVTDLEPAAARAQGWLATNQHTTSLDRCFRPDLVSKDVFFELVRLEYADMNSIPAHFRNYDFSWSICAFEHLGSIARGLAFVENSLETLAGGGVAVHTTEFNFANDEQTIDNWPTVLFQRRHFIELGARLRAHGHLVSEFDFNVGNKPMDKFIDMPPHLHDFKGVIKDSWSQGGNHLKISIDGFPSTCFGIIIRKAA